MFIMSESLQSLEAKLQKKEEEASKLKNKLQFAE